MKDQNNLHKREHGEEKVRRGDQDGDEMSETNPNLRFLKKNLCMVVEKKRAAVRVTMREKRGKSVWCESWPYSCQVHGME